MAALYKFFKLDNQVLEIGDVIFRDQENLKDNKYTVKSFKVGHMIPEVPAVPAVTEEKTDENGKTEVVVKTPSVAAIPAEYYYFAFTADCDGMLIEITQDDLDNKENHWTLVK